MFNPLHLYRVSHWVRRRGFKRVAFAVQRLNYFFTGADISAEARIGRNVHFSHCGMGVVLHQTVVMGDDIMVMPHVVIGQHVRIGGTVNLREIRIGNAVMLGAGAKIIADGQLEIGDRAVIGANAVVLKSVPPDHTAVGVPARILPPKNQRDPSGAAEEALPEGVSGTPSNT